MNIEKLNSRNVTSVFLEYLLSKVSSEIEKITSGRVNSRKIRLINTKPLLIVEIDRNKRQTFHELAKSLYDQIPLEDKKDFLRFCYLHKNALYKKFSIAVSPIYTALGLTDPDSNIREFATSTCQIHSIKIK